MKITMEAIVASTISALDGLCGNQATRYNKISQYIHRSIIQGNIHIISLSFPPKMGEHGNRVKSPNQVRKKLEVQISKFLRNDNLFLNKYDSLGCLREGAKKGDILRSGLP